MYETTRTGHPKLANVGIAYVILGALDILMGLLTLASFAMSALRGFDGHHWETSKPAEMGYMVGIGASGCAGLLAFVLAGVTIKAGLDMRRSESYSLAMAAVILNMIPCYTTCACGLLGVPLGIWGLVVLLDPDVKASFARR